MMTDFNDLFIFEMANNHEGDTEHGLRIIREFGDLARNENIRAAIKFQFRDLDSFIHADYGFRGQVKHVERFTRTKLSAEDFKTLLDEVKGQGLIAACTPFDEVSVDRILELGFDFVKVGSCSATDLPLLEKIADAGLPVIASTAGLDLAQIKNLVRILGHRGTPLALMHCVALYPTPVEALALNQIDVLRETFPGLTVGFSSHESPDHRSAVQIAYAKGARIFERHVGITTDRFKLNSYSGTPEQTRNWIHAYKEAVASCDTSKRNSPAELESLRSLMRGVYVSRDIGKGSKIEAESKFFAMPLLPGQLASYDWHEGLTADQDYSKNSFLPEALRRPNLLTADEILIQARELLKRAGLTAGPGLFEVSHHYGIERFNETGAVFV
ncbi:MAG: N-acetylneuraminate synthase family protein, partial [Bdellovibrionia bacterium]